MSDSWKYTGFDEKPWESNWRHNPLGSSDAPGFDAEVWASDHRRSGEGYDQEYRLSALRNLDIGVSGASSNYIPFSSSSQWSPPSHASEHSTLRGDSRLSSSSTSNTAADLALWKLGLEIPSTSTEGHRRKWDAELAETTRNSKFFGAIPKWESKPPSPMIQRTPSPEVIEHPYKGCPTHKELSFSDLATESGNPFTTHGHDARHLTKIIGHFVEHDYPAKRRAARDLRSSSYDIVAELYNGTMSDELVVQTYFRLLDDLYFFGSLYARTDLFLRENTEGMNAAGYAADLGKEMHIFITGKSNREERLKDYLETLLHEMCHAFLMHYGCREFGTIGFCHLEDVAQGERGHGFAWVGIAQAIQESTSKYLGLHFDLAIIRSWCWA